MKEGKEVGKKENERRKGGRKEEIKWEEGSVLGRDEGREPDQITFVIIKKESHYDFYMTWDLG